MKKNLFLLLFLLQVSLVPAFSQAEAPADRLQWFRDAKLGIFIHWGIYAVNGIDESWSFFNEYIPYDAYMEQLKGFNAEKYDPASWVSLIKESGARYAVLTSKHHDGVALWDSKVSELDVVDRTPAGRDLVAPFVKELRKQGLKVGLYYSLLDWSQPDYPNFTRTQKRYTDNPERWEAFMQFNLSQIREIQDKFKPDLYWFDGDWEQNAGAWHAKEIRRMILEKQPGAIINSRLAGYGDYATPEQGLPVTRPSEGPWELCMTMNDSWGYQPLDRNYKTPNQVIRILAECISLGGNLLLDIGPRADGTIPDEQVAILKELGRWTQKHEAAIYGTLGGIPRHCFYGPTTLSPDSTVLYLFMEHIPNGPVLLKGIRNDVARIWVVGNGTKLDWQVMMKPSWSQVPGLIYIDLPEEVLDPQVTVLAVQLKGKVDFIP